MVESKASLDRIVRDTLGVLTFRLSADRMTALGGGHLAFGLVCTWLVGIGRYWDDPRAEFAQKMGVGSVVYVFVLSLLLWGIARPLIRNPRWTYRHVLTYVTLVSPPAALYAIPVERYYGIDTASQINVWFLGVVALWRVALLFRFYRVFGQLPWGEVVVTGLLPLTGIVISLLILNLQHVVFDLMGGFRDPSSADGGYSVVLTMSVISVFAGPVLLLVYLWMVALRRGEWLASFPSDAGPPPPAGHLGIAVVPEEPESNQPETK